MEIIGTEGFLTDFEVLEVLQSKQYASYPSVDALKKQLGFQKRTADENKRAFRKIFTADSWNPRHVKEKEKRLEDALRSLERLQGQQDMVWVREHTIKYLQSQPGSVQSQEGIDKFVAGVKALQKKGGFELMTHEVLHLVNHRPTRPIELHVLVDEYVERIKEPHLTALFDMTSTMLPVPPPPPDVYGEDEEAAAAAAAEGDVDAVDGAGDEETKDGGGEAAMAELEELQAQAAAYTHEDSELNRDANAQADGDEDGMGDVE